MNIFYKSALLFYIPVVSGFLFQFLFAVDEPREGQQSPTVPGTEQLQKVEKAATAKLLFQSTDGGHTWQDISKGLPENPEETGFFANESGLYLQGASGLYYSKPNTSAASWKKEPIPFPGTQGSIAATRAGLVAYNLHGQFLQKINGTGRWVPVFTNFEAKGVRIVFETAGGTMLIATNNQLFKSANSGKTWKALRTAGPVMKMVEADGVLLATSTQGILRSTDDGENWHWVIKEGGVGIAVECIKDGFAAITYNAKSRTRRVRTSYDGGITWQPIDAGLQAHTAYSIGQPFLAGTPAQGMGDPAWGPNNDALPPQAFITSITQLGENFFCGHPSGIFRSSDKGKSWKLVLSSVEAKVFRLYVSGNVIYAIPVNAGC